MLDENSKYITGLIERSKGKNFKSYLQLVHLYSDGVFSFIHRILLIEDDSTRITINVFKFVWENIAQVRLNSSFITWLRGIALVFIMAEYRKDKEAFLHKLTTTKQKLYNNHSEVDNLIARLDFEYRLCLVLHDIIGYSLIEIEGIISEYNVEQLRQILDIARLRVGEDIRK